MLRGYMNDWLFDRNSTYTFNLLLNSSIIFMLNNLTPFLSAYHISPRKAAHKLPVQVAGQILSSGAGPKCIVALVFFGLQL